MVTEEINLKGYFSVAEHSGMAWYVLGYATEWTEEKWVFIGDENDDTDDETNYAYDEPEEIEDRTRVRCVMVGDDQVFVFDVDDLTEIDEEAFCHGCGQVGCCW